MDRKPDQIGWLPAAALGTLAIFLMTWAALHDVARGDGPLEYAVLGLCAVAFAGLERWAMAALTPPERMRWLAGVTVVLLLFATGAASAILRPRYATDSLVGWGFLAAGSPWLSWTLYRLRLAQ